MTSGRGNCVPLTFTWDVNSCYFLIIRIMAYQGYYNLNSGANGHMESVSTLSVLLRMTFTDWILNTYVEVFPIVRIERLSDPMEKKMELNVFVIQNKNGFVCKWNVPFIIAPPPQWTNAMNHSNYKNVLYRIAYSSSGAYLGVMHCWQVRSSLPRLTAFTVHTIYNTNQASRAETWMMRLNGREHDCNRALSGCIVFIPAVCGLRNLIDYQHDLPADEQYICFSSKCLPRARIKQINRKCSIRKLYFFIEEQSSYPIHILCIYIDCRRWHVQNMKHSTSVHSLMRRCITFGL